MCLILFYNIFSFTKKVKQKRKEGQEGHILVMKILYKNKKVEKMCTNEKVAIKSLGIVVAEKLFAAINVLSSAANLKDILALPQYHLHKLIGDLDGKYSMYLGRKTGYRLEIIPLDENEQKIQNEDMSLYTIAVCVEIERVSNHYE